MPMRASYSRSVSAPDIRVTPRHSLARSALPLVLLALAAPAVAQQVQLGPGSVVQTVTTLKAGQFVWAPQAAPEGPMLMIVSLPTQRALLFRNGVPIGATTVSTGKAGHDTPTGVFTILQKQIEHYSSKYDSAPMPYMQRLTWGGVALHAGKLPGYPASHGCIRLPAGFAKLLYGATKLGMTVVIADQKVTPRIAPAPNIVALPSAEAAVETYDWHPERSPQGPVSIVVSSEDGKAVVLRNGVEIGAAKVIIDGPVSGTWAYTLRNVDGSGQHWIRVSLSLDELSDQPVPREEWRRFHAADAFRRSVAEIVRPGTTIVVTSDSLVSGAVASPVTVIESTAK
ncbi:MAG: L,D-transpeptidase family protein [Sphingomicrobium sp.]